MPRVKKKQHTIAFLCIVLFFSGFSCSRKNNATKTQMSVDQRQKKKIQKIYTEIIFYALVISMVQYVDIEQMKRNNKRIKVTTTIIIMIIMMKTKKKHDLFYVSHLSCQLIHLHIDNKCVCLAAYHRLLLSFGFCHAFCMASVRLLSSPSPSSSLVRRHFYGILISQ